jgi:signal transduction histidine kinase
MNSRENIGFASSGLDMLELMEALFYRDEFLAVASHELRTPLTGLKLQTQVFKRLAKKSPEVAYSQHKVDQLVDQMEHQVGRLSGLIDNMLDISRIRSGQFGMVKESFNLTETLNLVLQRFEVTQRFDQKILFYGDHQRLAQVFSILLDNAKKYGQGIPLEVHFLKKRGRILFSVTDFGFGLKEEDQKRIFNRFQRAIAATQVSGLGLGLYIAKEIVSAHGGKISVRSVPHQGSTFSISFKAENLL